MSAPVRNPRSRATRVPTKEARLRIIQATTRLLAERRFRDLTVDDVMREARLGRTIFYRHFGSLADIVVDLLGELMAEIVAEAARGAAHDRGLLRRQLALVVDTFHEHGRLLVAFDDAAHHDAKIELAYGAASDQAAEITAQFLQQGVEEGHTPPLPVREVARALTAMNARYLRDLAAREPEFDRQAALEALWTVWVRTTWPVDE